MPQHQYSFISSRIIPGALLILCFGSLIQSCQFSRKTSRKLYEQASKEEFDVIVVPGVPFENQNWSRTMKARVYWAKYLFDKGIAKNIMFSGGAVYTPYPEAEIMSMYAQALGVPQENIFVETLAEHSTENIFYSYRKAKALGFRTMALASDPFQTKMLRKFTRNKVDDKIALIPFVTDTLKMLEPEMTDPAIDFEKVLVPDFKSIKQRESFWTRLRGTMGKRIRPDAYN